MKNTTRLKIILLLSTMTSISFHSALLGQAGRTAKKSIQERWDFDRIRFDIYKRSGQVIDVIKRYFPHEIDTTDLVQTDRGQVLPALRPARYGSSALRFPASRRSWNDISGRTRSYP